MTGRRSWERIQSATDTLVDKRTGAFDRQRWQRYADDPIGFIRHVCGEANPGPWSAQEEIAESVRDYALTVVRSCNGAGKDWLAARLALWAVYARGYRVLLTGPTRRQVSEIVMREVHQAFAKAGSLPGELYQNSLRLGRTETAGILAFTSSEASKLTGFHSSSGVFAILTEAQGVEDFAYEGLLACATGDQDRILAVGNPLAPSGEFFRACQPASPWTDFKISALEHPNVQTGREVIPGAVTQAFVERMAAQYGEDSAMYRSRVRGEFAAGGADRLIPDPEWISQANDLHAKIETFRETRIPLPTEDNPRGHRLVVGVDVARFGEDTSVLCFRRGPYVEGFTDLPHRTRTTEVTGHVIRALKDRCLSPDNRRAYKIIVDEIGVGGGVVDELHDAGFPVTGCNVSAPPPAGTDDYLNVRAFLYWTIRDRLDEGTLALPPSDGLREELLAHSWSPNAKGKIQLAKKDAVRAELGRSPDFSDSLALTFAGSHQATRGGALGITL